MFFGVSSSVTECFRDYLQPVNRTRDTKKHGRRSSRDDTATSLLHKLAYYISVHWLLTAFVINSKDGTT